jgi:hypothetical protein
MFYDSSLTQTDVDILKIIENKKEIFRETVKNSRSAFMLKDMQNNTSKNSMDEVIVSVDISASTSVVLNKVQSKDNLSREA